MRTSIRTKWIIVATVVAAAGCEPTEAPSVEPADVEVTQSALVGTDVAGTWFLNANGSRVTATITGSGPFTGTLINENGGTETLDNIALNGSFLEFRRDGAGFFQWYRLLINRGVAAGRFSHSASSSKPALTQFTFHATGWRQDLFPGLPLAWELLVNGNFRARLHIDNNGVGRFKVYSTVSGGASGEDVEYDLTNVAWDGTHLSFTRNVPGQTQVYTGTATGRTISGTFTANGSGSFPWNGTRAEVLSYGAGGGWSASSSASRLSRLRSRLTTLMMAGNPGASVKSTTTTTHSLITGSPVADRDDNSTSHPQSYTLKEYTRVLGLTNLFDNSAASRTIHGFIATPTTAAPPGGYRIAIAVNGHGGSAFQTMQASNPIFWYGDSFARRGFLVVSVDISHRPASDTPLYNDGFNAGDDPANGNGPHPSIKNSTGGTDFEEDGERVWDVMRAVDLALAQPNVNASHVLVTGLSMGGEVATLAAAMDTRIGMAIPAGYSPDMGVMLFHGNHPCWQWVFGDIREYVDVADFESLIAPRPLIVETGKQDATFSSFTPPFAADKQVVRRGRTAYVDQGALSDSIHYLHYDVHHYHVGEASPSRGALGVQATSVGSPNPPGSLGWQSDSTTFTQSSSLFSDISSLFP
jgi:hypothetical protein